ncbi:hypothetical protein [Psychroserpens sp. Hel_I_66]|uniref:hypothetical protein n=1 Tax=Psychroserpens sp. Hel_I_66 TaxID=1250004 RepID=UPI0018CD46B4|nr:hypothetical protein [Psychroserpens sp. Hel_I_66]
MAKAIGTRRSETVRSRPLRVCALSTDHIIDNTNRIYNKTGSNNGSWILKPILFKKAYRIEKKTKSPSAIPLGA